jgi:plastocyanin
LRVGVGTTVTTTNDETAASHTWTSNDGAWDSGTLAPGANYAFTFSSSGTFEYHCNIHPSMKGSVIVS